MPSRALRHRSLRSRRNCAAANRQVITSSNAFGRCRAARMRKQRGRSTSDFAIPTRRIVAALWTRIVVAYRNFLAEQFQDVSTQAASLISHAGGELEQEIARLDRSSFLFANADPFGSTAAAQREMCTRMPLPTSSEKSRSCGCGWRNPPAACTRLRNARLKAALPWGNAAAGDDWRRRYGSPFRVYGNDAGSRHAAGFSGSAAADRGSCQGRVRAWWASSAIQRRSLKITVRDIRM